MSDYNVSTRVSFWSTKMVIKEVLSASKLAYFALAGKSIERFEPGKVQRMEDFGNRFVVQTADKPFPQCDWVEFTV